MGRALTNVARHAVGCAVEASFRRKAGSVVLLVLDNGRGMPEDADVNGHRAGRTGETEVRLEVPTQN